MDLDFENKFRTIVKKIEECGNVYAEKKAQSWQAQEMRTVVLSKLIKAQGDIPVSKAEINAKASEDYEKFLDETANAIKRELETKAQYEKWKSSFEALRSLSSLEKSTRHNLGGDT